MSSADLTGSASEIVAASVGIVVVVANVEIVVVANFGHLDPAFPARLLGLERGVTDALLLGCTS